MRCRPVVVGLVAFLALPGLAPAAGNKGLDLPVWSVAPFILLLMTIALCPVVAGRWWHKNQNRALIVALYAVPAAVYLLYLQLATGQETLSLLLHEIDNYVSFIILLGSLYIVAGGIVLRGSLRPRPLTNAALLAFGAALANAIGTTGASVLLVRPLLRINQPRRHTAHIPVFFIFAVSNLGGLLTPLGDPPLFLGFLNGVPFSWTLRLWPQWLLANGSVLLVFMVWDTLAYRREAATDLGQIPAKSASIRLEGVINLFFLAGIILGVLLQGSVPAPWGSRAGTLLMALMGIFSLLFTHRDRRADNAFTWGPIIEIAILFAGIFVTMVPAQELLARHGSELRITQPWEFFWLTGLLSGFLDNAPTYLTFSTMAAGSTDLSLLVNDQISGLNGPLVLQAISCGAVFMGALTYIGNGPNFMVKAIADEAGFRTPSFLGYVVYSSLVLVPIFLLITFVFFRPS